MGRNVTKARPVEQLHRSPSAWKALHQVATSEGPAHLGEGLLLELADALAGQVVLVPDLLERQLLLGAEAEALAEDIRLDRAQLAEQVTDLGRERLPLEVA